MDCTNCGAPLPPKTNRCNFCSTLNDTDLRGIERRGPAGPRTDRQCPRCAVKLSSVLICLGDGELHVERCRRCHGLFFDPGEVETVLEGSVASVFEIDHERIEVLLDEEAPTRDQPVRYVPCPVCGKLMNRRNYGARAGVIIDHCKNDGVWLDGGELGHLMKWTKAGGGLLDQRRQQDEERHRRQLARQPGALDQRLQIDQRTGRDHEEPLLVGVLDFVRRLVG